MKNIRYWNNKKQVVKPLTGDQLCAYNHIQLNWLKGQDDLYKLIWDQVKQFPELLFVDNEDGTYFCDQLFQNSKMTDYLAQMDMDERGLDQAIYLAFFAMRGPGCPPDAFWLSCIQGPKVRVDTFRLLRKWLREWSYPERNKEPRVEAVSCCYDFLKPVIVSRSQTMLSLLIQFFGLQMLADTIKIRFLDMGVSNQVEVDAKDGRHLYLIIWRLALGYKFSSILGFIIPRNYRYTRFMMEQPLQLSVKSSKVFFRLLEYVDPAVLKELLEFLAVSECGDIRHGMTVYEDILHSVDPEGNNVLRWALSGRNHRVLKVLLRLMHSMSLHKSGDQSSNLVLESATHANADGLTSFEYALRQSDFLSASAIIEFVGSDSRYLEHSRRWDKGMIRACRFALDITLFRSVEEWAQLGMCEFSYFSGARRYDRQRWLQMLVLYSQTILTKRVLDNFNLQSNCIQAESGGFSHYVCYSNQDRATSRKSGSRLFYGMKEKRPEVLAEHVFLSAVDNKFSLFYSEERKIKAYLKFKYECSNQVWNSIGDHDL